MPVTDNSPRFTRTLPTPSVIHSDGFVFVLSAGWFTQADGAIGSPIDGGVNSLANGGGDLVAFSDTACANKIPVHVVSFVTGVSPSAEVWVRLPSYASGDSITIAKDDTQTSQPAPNDTYGQYAVYQDHFYWTNDGVSDVTGNNTITQFGSPGTGTSPWGGTSLTLDGGGTQYGRSLVSIPLQRPMTYSAWVKLAPASPNGSYIGGYVSSSGFIYDNLGLNNSIHRLQNRNISNVTVVSSQTPVSGDWDRVVGRSVSISDRRINNDGVIDTSTDTNNPQASTIDRITYGLIDDATPSPTTPDGELTGLRVTLGDISDAYIADERENQLNPDSFGSSSEWQTAQAGNELSASFSINKGVFSASITNQAINNEASVSYTANKPLFSSSITNEPVSNDLSVSFTANKPSFSASINNSAGSNLVSVNLSMKQPVFTASIDNTQAANELTASFTTNKALFSASITNELVNNEVSVNLSMKTPNFTVNVQNGDVVVKFNAETNYTQDTLSTNYNGVYLSTNYTQD